MAVVVFSGPTLAPEAVRRHLDATCLPPVSQGDVYRASLESPLAIGIIDGYFESVPSVWHKEILWALSRGIHVFGAASMGALRAAELTPYGMVGIGEIFESYHRGLLTDDDEVAVLHGPEDMGFPPFSEALVNIRATLARAVAEQVIGEGSHDALLGIARSLFYGDRDYATLLARALEQEVDRVDVERLREWLPAGRVDQKALDAVTMLERIREVAERSPPPFQPRFHFEHTDMWEQVIRRSGLPPPGAGSSTLPSEPLLDELRLLGPGRVSLVQERALGRVLGLEEARRQGVGPPPGQIEAEALRFRRERGLRSEEALSWWLAEQGLSPEGFLDLVEQEVRLDQVRALFAPVVGAQVQEVLRIDGDRGALAKRARDKQVLLARHGLEEPHLEDAGIGERELLEWHFGETDRPVPDDLDSYVSHLGCADRHAFQQLLLRELCYRKLRPAGD